MKLEIYFDDFLNEKMKDDLIASSEVKRLGKSTRIQVDYKGMNHRSEGKRIKTLNFYAVDPGGSQKTHNISVKIPDYRLVSRIKKLNTEDKLKYAVEAGDVQVFCDCRDFLYHGYKYMADLEDYGIKSEDRPPDITNPNLDGALCKHIIAVFNQMDKFYNQIVNDIEEHAKKERIIK